MCVSRAERAKVPEAIRDGSQLPAPLLSKLRRRLLPVLWLGFMFNIVNRSNLAFAQIQMAPELGMSQADFGFAAGILNVYRLASGFGYASGYTKQGEQAGGSVGSDEGI